MKMRTITILATTAVLAAGCSSEDIAERVAEEAAERIADGDGEVDLDFDEEGGNINVETSEGSISMGSGGDLPESFPEDLPLPEGDYQVVTSGEQSSDTDGTSVTAVLMTDESHDDVVAHFEEVLADTAWEISDTHRVSGSEMDRTTFMLSTDDQEGMVNVQRPDDATMVSYTITDVDE